VPARDVLGLLPLLGATGCATSLSAIGSPTFDTSARVGHEERLEVTAAAGDPGFRFYASAGAGLGYLRAAGSGYALVSPGLGVEGGKDLLWSAGATYAPRFFFTGASTAHGIGAQGQLLYRLGGMGGEDGSLLAGLRLSAEDLPARDTGLFQLGLVVRWITFDTTGKGWGF
jgi:hypothetical protein